MKFKKFLKCECGMKEFCAMFGQNPACDEEVPEIEEQHLNTKGGAR